MRSIILVVHYFTVHYINDENVKNGIVQCYIINWRVVLHKSTCLNLEYIRNNLQLKKCYSTGE